MLRVTKQEKTFVAAVSVALGLIQLVTLVINELFLKAKLILETDQLFFLALIIALFPPAVVSFLDLRWRMSVDKNIPEFLRELSEAGRTGVTLTRALDLASKRRYGPLSKELGRVVARLSWGGDYESAMRDFAKRIDTKLAKRTSILLTEISRAGGEIRDVLDIISKHIRELQSIDDERRSQLKIYVGIVYISFFIFLFIDYILIVTFFAKMEALRTATTEAGGLFLMKELGLKGIKQAMYHMSIVQGIFGGLIAGKMGENAIGAGLKHALILIVIGWVVFFLLI
jgi:flagellar protein FlaJ